eukprot:CAMPEP_0181339614 /NCGR_PEP_ID=MMETSP1101-20121128/29365_1 /TAXON_ID=46948 /ORGANISM="Rhodomonas abbreviata, Strain Caron Lab Isolate" /LENGTH=31 /DNA_ID= /DNA_START= /DNA_END= /DNA_ORIENTATION=
MMSSLQSSNSGTGGSCSISSNFKSGAPCGLQ